MDNSNNDLAKIIETEYEEPEYTGGQQITPHGIINDKGEIIPRAKNEARPNLSPEDEYTIDMWNKQMSRDFPTIDPVWIDMISTFAYLHPEEAEEFARTETLKKANGTAAFSATPPNLFKEMEEKYQRVYI